MIIRTFVIAAATAAAAVGAVATQQQNQYLGRWNLQGTGENSTYVYWLEVKDEGGQLTGMFLNRGGSPVKLGTVKIDNGEIVFALPPGRNNAPSPEYHAKLQGEKLVGSVQLANRKVDFVGTRPPKWPPADANASHTFGKPVDLFDGKSMDAWDVQDKSKPMGWVIEEGAMTNTPPANNLVSKQKFKDFKIHAEYKLTQGSNSGIYLRGRYELQVLDDYGKPPEAHSHMSVYAWHAPLVNASKPAGEWQMMEATLVANKVTVFLNGQKVQDNATLEAITGGALDANETEPGPIMLQGDHEKVWYRKVTVTPISR
jgi:3-keto-disaccharide hydrolase